MGQFPPESPSYKRKSKFSSKCPLTSFIVRTEEPNGMAAACWSQFIDKEMRKRKMKKFIHALSYNFRLKISNCQKKTKWVKYMYWFIVCRREEGLSLTSI